MTTEELKKEAEEYGIDLCAYCRECEGEKPCQHKIDAMHGYQDGLKARENHIAELEKENVELKKSIEYWKQEYGKLFDESEVEK